MVNGDGVTGWMKFLPILVIYTTIVLAAGGSQIQIRALAENAIDQETDFDKALIVLTGDIDSNQETIEEIQRLLIERQGEQNLAIFELQTDIERQSDKMEDQSEKLDRLLLLLQTETREGR